MGHVKANASDLIVFDMYSYINIYLAMCICVYMRRCISLILNLQAYQAGAKRSPLWLWVGFKGDSNGIQI